MKLKFIFNTVHPQPRRPSASDRGAKPAAFAIRAVLKACLVLRLLGFLAPTPMASAQQPNAPSATAPDSAPQSDPSNVAHPPPDESTETMLPHFKDSRFWLSGQANFIFQTHPPFHAPYSGPNSLGPNYEKATSRVLTLYTGFPIDNSTEILVDLEEAGGSALSTGLGLAGNTDLDIVRNPSLSKAPYFARVMIHKVFALSRVKIKN